MQPLGIRYSQDSIGCKFGHYTRHPNRPIGETLDDILLGRTFVQNIPIISVMIIHGLYFTSDNRRLWVFQKLQELGVCCEIPVNLLEDITRVRPEKFTTRNGGLSASVRGSPGGSYWLTIGRTNLQRPRPVDYRQARQFGNNYKPPQQQATNVHQSRNRGYGTSENKNSISVVTKRQTSVANSKPKTTIEQHHTTHGLSDRQSRNNSGYKSDNGSISERNQVTEPISYISSHLMPQRSLRTINDYSDWQETVRGDNESNLAAADTTAIICEIETNERCDENCTSEVARNDETTEDNNEDNCFCCNFSIFRFLCRYKSDT